MKILLIDPPYTLFTGFTSRYFPVGLGYVASALKAAGHEVSIYEVDRENMDTGDLNFNEEYLRLNKYLEAINSNEHEIWQKLKKVVKEYNPDAIGITSMTMKFGSAIKTAEMCKSVKPEVKVIMGGPHVTDWVEICFQSTNVDICVSGETEETIVKILNTLHNPEGLADIPGVSYKKENKIFYGKPCIYIEDINTISMPLRESLLNIDHYSSEDMGVIMTSRGCPFRCAFCSHPQKVRYRNLDNVIEEIKHVIVKYHTKQFAFKDDSFTVSKKRVIQFCEMLIKEGIQINWDCTTRVDILDDELIGIMKKAGCNTIKVGIETGSQRILEKMNKKVTFEQMKYAAKLFKKHKMFWSGYFMFGLPYETKEEMMQTLKFMKELKPNYAGLGLYAPIPNTELWKEGIESGLLDANIRIDHFFNTNPKDYFFKDKKKRVLSMEEKEFEELSKYLMNEFNKHNTGILVLMKRGWSRKNAYLKDFKLLYNDINKAMKWLFHVSSNGKNK